MKKNIKDEVIDIVFLLDRSGSMSGMESDTISGYNSYLNKMKNQNAYITTVLFDDSYELLTKRGKINSTKHLNDELYYTRGMTALYDAIGKTIKEVERYKSQKVLFIITTDGLENSSKEFNKDTVKKLIKNHSSWEFMFIGANIDSYNEARSIGIKQTLTSNYTKSSKGTKNLFKSIEKASVQYARCDYISNDWKEELSEYIKQNS